MGIKNFLMRKMVQSKMKNVPPEQQEKILAMIEKNPDFFQKIALEVQEKVKQGKDQMAATMEVMTKYQSDLNGML
jgi:predicted DNA-binding protein